MALADDLADGEGPDVVRAFRARILALSRRPDLAAELQRRKERVYGTILPGLGTLSPDALSQVTGDAAQEAAWNAFLQAAGLPPATRVYPRDVWE